MEHELGVALGPEPDDRKAGGLGLGAHDGEVLADQGVEERGFADIGRAGEGDVAGSGGMREDCSLGIETPVIPTPSSARWICAGIENASVALRPWEDAKRPGSPREAHGAFIEWLATAYSLPRPRGAKYHRRCRS